MLVSNMEGIDPDLDLHRSLWDDITTVYMAPYDWSGVKDRVRRSFIGPSVSWLFFEGVGGD